MADPSLKVWACLEFDTASGTCTSEGWIEPPTVIPSMTVDDAQTIGMSIALLWATAFGVRMLKRALTSIG